MSDIEKFSKRIEQLATVGKKAGMHQPHAAEAIGLNFANARQDASRCDVAALVEDIWFSAQWLAVAEDDNTSSRRQAAMGLDVGLQEELAG